MAAASLSPQDERASEGDREKESKRERERDERRKSTFIRRKSVVGLNKERYVNVGVPGGGGGEGGLGG